MAYNNTMIFLQLDLSTVVMVFIWLYRISLLLIYQKTNWDPKGFLSMQEAL